MSLVPFGAFPVRFSGIMQNISIIFYFCFFTRQKWLSHHFKRQNFVESQTNEPKNTEFTMTILLDFPSMTPGM